MGRTKELLETMHDQAYEEFIENKFFYETHEAFENCDIRVLD